MQPAPNQPPKNGLPTLRVLFLTAEAEPFIKVGGLGDVSGALPRALACLPPAEIGFNLDIILALPFHSAIQRDAFPVDRSISFSIPSTDGPIAGQAAVTRLDSIPVLLISGAPIPEDGPVYSMDTRADGDKFVFASLGALQAVRGMGWQPDVIHANDWHTAPAVYFVSIQRATDPFFRDLKTVLTIHNLPFIGVGTAPSMEKFGLPPVSGQGLPWWAEQLPLPVGLATADRIVTVSPGYSREILSPGHANGLESLLLSRKSRLSGILNGIDTESWNPAADPGINTRYDAFSLERRQSNKAFLQEVLTLPQQADIPLLAFIGRMDPQKGIDILIDSLHNMLDLEWQAVILGTGDETLEGRARDLEQASSGRLRAVLRYDNNLARQIYAGSDILVMPSRYEPCGLAQMIAMHYGCVPVAVAVGGLMDTIQRYPQDSNPTGFLVGKASPQSLAESLCQALEVFKDKTTWRGLQTNGMLKDFSWNQSARAYAQIYKLIEEEP